MSIIKYFLSALAILTFISVSFASFPSLNFQQENFQAGQVDLEFEASVGTRLEILINENYLGARDVTSPTKTFYLNNEIEDIQISVGQSLEIFNNNSQINYQLDIENIGTEILSYGQKIILNFDEVSQINYKNVQSSVQKKIYVDNRQENVIFQNVDQTYLLDGTNEIKIIQKPINNNNFDPIEYIFNFNYEKYPNTILFENFKNITNTRDFQIQGTVTDLNSPLYYLINYQGVISNTGILNQIQLQGNSFNHTISLQREGENIIRIISTDPNNDNIFTGEIIRETILDTIPPRLDILSISYDAKGNTFEKSQDQLESGLFVNSQSLNFELETNDGIYLNYSLNGVNTSMPFDENGKLNLTLNLQNEKTNNLTFTVADLAGNIYYRSHAIQVDSTDPSINWRTIEPQEIFSGRESANFMFQSVKGNTTKPNVKITAFTIDDSADTMDSQGNSVRVSCNDYEPYFIRNLGGRANIRDESSNIDLDDLQINLVSSMFQEVKTTSNSRGNFDLILGLRERTLNINQDNTVDRVATDNTVCFVLEDKFGNIKIESRTVKLDSGNTMWRAGEITTIPNTLYAAEIEMTGDQRAGTGKTQFSVIARFNYIGPGKITEVSGVYISQKNPNSQEVNSLTIKRSEINWVLDKDKNELIVYVPVEVNPRGIKPIDYPSELSYTFQITNMGYVLDDTNIPIDSVNPIYFPVTLNVERPLDHTKWLTPEMLDKGIKFLNKSIEYTKKATDFMQTATVVGMVTCTGAKFYYGAQMAMAEDQETRNDYQEKLYQICDRVVCSASPDECNSVGGSDFNLNGKNSFSGADIADDPSAQFTVDGEDGEIMGRVTGLRIGNPCVTSSGKPGVMANIDVTKYNQDITNFGWVADSTSQRYIPNECVEAEYENQDNIFQENPQNERLELRQGANLNIKPNSINLQSVSGICYTETAPRFDNTRCNFFSSDNGQPGKNSKDNIIESISCGCITDTYSHLKNYLKIQESIRGCLEQAKIGVVKGAYCERLLAQAVCDIATSVLYKSMTGSVSSSSHSDTRNPSVFAKALAGAKEGDKLLNDRYQGTFYSQAGLSSDNIVNKVCIGAISGDWSILTDSIMGAIEKNEVKPIFGPMIPESRMQGYNPFTGDLTIQYRFTYAGVSGGQHIRSTVSFVCDSNKPGGDHCPPGVTTSQEAGSSFRTPNLQILTDGSAQDLIVVTDEKARYRYNVIVLEHKYTLDGVQETQIQEETINHKGELMLANCYFTAGVLGSGSGFGCGTLFDEEQLVTGYKIMPNTYLAPSRQSGSAGVPFYSGNKLFLNLFYDISSSQNSADLVYQITCRSGTETIKNSYFKNLNFNTQIGNIVTDLLQIPNVEEHSDPTYTRLSFTGNIPQENGGELEITFSSTDATQNIIAEIRSIKINGKTITSNEAILIPNRLNIQNGLVNELVSIPFSTLNLTNTQNIRTIVIELNKEVSALNGQIFMDSNMYSLTSSVVNSQDSLNSLPSGSSCSLVARLLPSGLGDAAKSADNLKEYNPAGDNLQTGGINTQNIFETTFKVSGPPTDDSNNLYFDVTKPIRNQILCLDQAGQIDIQSVANNQLNLLTTSQKIEYTISLNRYTQSQTIKETLELRSLQINKISIKDEIKNLLTGDITRLDATLHYKVVDKTGISIDDNNRNTQQPQSGSIPFKIGKVESCGVETQSHSQPQGTTEEGTGNEQEGSDEDIPDIGY